MTDKGGTPTKPSPKKSGGGRTASTRKLAVSGSLTSFDDSLIENGDTTESEDDLQAIDPSLLGQAVVFGTDWTAATLIDQLKRGNIKLDPIFQRRDAWDSKRKSRFIESIVLGLPIPQIVLAEAKDERGAFLVIDGKQRLLSLQQFAGVASGTPLALAGLLFREELNGKTYDDLQNDARLRSHKMPSTTNPFGQLSSELAKGGCPLSDLPPPQQRNTPTISAGTPASTSSWAVPQLRR